MTNYEWIKTMATKQEILMILLASALQFMDDYTNSEKYMLKKEYEKFLDSEHEN